MKLKQNGIVKTILIISISFFFIACSSKVISIKPSWINDTKSTIGVCGFIPSENLSIQKEIAIKRAISSLVIKKGISSGDITVKSNKLYTFKGKSEKLVKLTYQNSNIDFWFNNIIYNVKITDMWKDPQTKELYIKIEEI